MIIPALADVLATARVVALPLRTRFRGLTVREAMVFEGPQGWTEFSPFAEYDDAEAAAWLRAAYDFGWMSTPELFRSNIEVNATVPAVDPDRVEAVLASFGNCRTVKVKVAEPLQTLAEDVARVHRVRELIGPEGRIRIDANGAWNVDEAEHAIHAMADADLEYVEQPCASIKELAEIRKRVKYMAIPIAADESVRKASDPFAVVEAQAANILVLKAQPLGGVHAALDIAARAGLPVVVSSALDTSIGLAMGAHLAAALPELDYDCGLGTAALLAADVVTEPLIPVDGKIPVARPIVNAAALDTYAADAERTVWWIQRLERVHALVSTGSTD
jgi:O-succinylbenzoate synthase